MLSEVPPPEIVTWVADALAFNLKDEARPEAFTLVVDVERSEVPAPPAPSVPRRSMIVLANVELPPLMTSDGTTKFATVSRTPAPGALAVEDAVEALMVTVSIPAAAARVAAIAFALPVLFRVTDTASEEPLESAKPKVSVPV